MSLQSNWERATSQTKVVRWKKNPLATFDSTVLKYAFLAESLVNAGDTVERKGRIMVHRPLLLLPENVPQFEGFDFLKDMSIDDEELARFLLIRGVSFPSLKFRNETDSLNVVEKPLEKALEQTLSELDKTRNVDTGVLTGPEECWQFSVLVYVGGLMARSASRDIDRLMD